MGGEVPGARVEALARIRWLLAGAACCYSLAVSTVDWAVGLRLGLPWPLFVVVLPTFIAIYNLAGLARLGRGEVGRAVWIGLAGDLVAATIALVGTGGAGSWLWTLYPLITLEAAFLTERRRPTVMVALLGLGGYLLATAAVDLAWLGPARATRLALAERDARGLEGLQATWVAIMDFLAAAAGLMALEVLVRVSRELRTAYHQLDEQYQALGQLERAKAAFLSGVSHELRTPLAIIQGHAEALADDPAVPAAGRAAARTIEEQAMGLAEKVTQVLAYTSLAGGTATLRRGEVRVAELLEGVLEAGRGPCLAARVVLLVGEVAPDAVVDVDPDAVIQALTQLVENACAAAPPRSTVGLTATRRGDGWAFEVRDLGPGVPAAVRTSLGIPFTQGSLALTAHQPGLGLGLAYARLVATLHGGTLEAEDRPGGGTVARLRLPG